MTLAGWVAGRRFSPGSRSADFPEPRGAGRPRPEGGHGRRHQYCRCARCADRPAPTSHASPLGLNCVRHSGLARPVSVKGCKDAGAPGRRGRRPTGWRGLDLSHGGAAGGCPQRRGRAGERHRGHMPRVALTLAAAGLLGQVGDEVGAWRPEPGHVVVALGRLDDHVTGGAIVGAVAVGLRALVVDDAGGVEIPVGRIDRVGVVHPALGRLWGPAPRRR